MIAVVQRAKIGQDAAGLRTITHLTRLSQRLLEIIIGSPRIAAVIGQRAQVMEQDRQCHRSWPDEHVKRLVTAIRLCKDMRQIFFP